LLTGTNFHNLSLSNRLHYPVEADTLAYQQLINTPFVFLVCLHGRQDSHQNEVWQEKYLFIFLYFCVSWYII